MGSIGSRLRKLEGFRNPERCPVCKDKIVFVEEHEDGTETYPDGRPCPECRGKADSALGPVCFLLVPCGTESCPVCEPRRTPRGEGVAAIG